MQSLWNQKQEKGIYSSTKETSIQGKKEDQGVLSVLDSIAEEAKESKSKMEVQVIYSKIQTGKKLTRAEKEYLRENDPETYKKVSAIEQKRKAFKRELKSCKTKEEVQRLKFTYQSESLMSIKKISNNPNISDGEKLAFVMIEYAKSQAIEEAVQEFRKCGEYGKLPTDVEYAQAMDEINEKKEPIVEQTSEKNDEISDSEGEPEESIVFSKENLIQTPPEENLKKETKTELKPSKAEFDTTFESGKVKKVKRAKAKAAYAATSQELSENTDIFRSFGKV